MTRTHDTNPVRLRREQLGLLLVELARNLGRSPAFVSSVEHGFVPRRMSQLEIADALTTTPEALWPQEHQ